MNKSISAVVTVHNKQATIAKTLETLLLQTGEFKEIIVLDDASTDNSASVIKNFTDRNSHIKYVFQNNHSVAKSLNTALNMTSGDFVAVLDGDVALPEDWLSKIMPNFENQEIAAVSGLTKTLNPKNIWAALAGFNVEFRQSRIKNEFVDHLSSTNVIFRKKVLDEIGPMDPAFTYGQDNEVSYRIIAAGYKLILSKNTFCLHFWPESFLGYVKQRMHGAWGRMMLIKKHPKRFGGDKVSGLRYFLELPLGLFFFATLAALIISADFLPVTGLAVIAIYAYQFNEILFFLKRRKILIAVLMPVIIAVRTVAWLFGIISYYVK